MTKTSANEPTNHDQPIIESVEPNAALPGGEVEIRGKHLGPVNFRTPSAYVGSSLAPILLSRSDRMVVRVPEVEAGKLEIRQNGGKSNAVDLKVAREVATEIHAVANPAVDSQGRIYTTFSGPRGQTTPVSVFRVNTDDELEVFLTGVMNATGLAVDVSGYLYVSSRHEGTVYRVSPEGAASVYAEGMGVATGVAFDATGNLYVGDRSGTIFKIATDRQIFVFATLEPSIAAYHLAFGLDGTLFVTGPTTSSNDNVYAIDLDGTARVYYRGLGRPQGLAVDVAGNLYVAASMGGRRGVVRITPKAEASLVIAGSGIVGLAFGPNGAAILATNDAIYHCDLGIEGLRFF